LAQSIRVDEGVAGDSDRFVVATLLSLVADPT
jgi:hypothetical protein